MCFKAGKIGAGAKRKKMCRRALETDAVEVSAKMVANCSKLKARHDPGKQSFLVRAPDQC